MAIKQASFYPLRINATEYSRILTWGGIPNIKYWLPIYI